MFSPPCSAGSTVRSIKLAKKVFSAKTVCPTAGSQLYVFHGLLGNAGNWTTASRYLVEHRLLRDTLRRIIAVDMRNHGSSLHSSDHSNAALASDLEGLVLGEQQELIRTFPDPALCTTRNSILIGHSMGGLTVIGALLRRANEDRLLGTWVDNLDNTNAATTNRTWQTESLRQCSGAMRAVNEEFGFAPSQPISDVLFDNPSASLSPSANSGIAARIPPLGRIAGAIIVDVTPTMRLGEQRSCADNVKETLDRMTQVRLDAIHSYKEAHAELIRVGMTDQAMRDFVTTNIALDPTNKSKPAQWRCNLDVLSGDYGSFQPSITNWFTSSSSSSAAAGAESATAVGQASSADQPPQPCTLPVMFVFGGKSPYNEPDHRQRISKYFTRATQVEVADAGHFVHYEKPREFADAVAPFIVSLIEKS
ncbi:hypothetical protein JKF63_06302 [Porcisia hertigi]|uniref:AB hydrolase-1 domain-containing protein n=1 Tax=Porcisia hertigi TaxID=2761500 RepID=A0A836INJ8_9TRYP|nr:hypothetical protein JKF63_06302 [Porcisia hertigi]